jgi:5-(carboxyamino)imidazole ribonucleotide mutase
VRKVSSVSIILGSDSDIEVYERAAKTLQELEVSYERRILSAHRTPDELHKYVKDAKKRGIMVFIAAAGMAAALPGAIASYTHLPVIGVPAVSKSPVLGLDSIFSILQMPPGVPVACVSVNGGENAALLAAQILALGDDGLGQRILSYRERMKQKVKDKDRRFRDR